ncbi:MAG: histidine phosphatase family protein [Sphingobacteriaceae bacterium]
MILKTIYLIRHGETDLNKAGIVQGRGLDTILNETGQQQAELFFEAYRNVPFDKIYTSKLQRTHQSVQRFIDLQIPWEQLAGLDELAWGVYEGTPNIPATQTAFRELLESWLSGNLDDKFDKGESPLEVQRRQIEAFNIIMSHPEEKEVLVCMHGRAMRLLLCTLTAISLTQMENFPHHNLTLYKMVYDSNSFNIAEFNNTDHLKNKDK